MQGAKLGSATASRGSEAHKTVYTVGKFFGVNFKPWGAVKVARAFGNAGRVIGAVGGLIAVAAQIAEDKQQENQRSQLRDARYEVRSNYSDVAREVESAFWVSYNASSSAYYNEELRAVESQRNELLGQHHTRSAEAEALAKVVAEVKTLIEEIQAVTA